MTLLVALKGKGGVVLAADSRATFGDPRGVTAQNDSQVKVHILSRHVAVAVAGTGEVGAMVIDLTKKQITDQDGSTAISELLRQTARGSYQQWFPSVPPIAPAGVMPGQIPTRPTVDFLVAGYEGSEARLLSFASGFDFAPMLHAYGWAVSGVPTYALYLLNRLYAADRTVEELTALAVVAITETARQDGKVGGPVNVITISPEDGCQPLDTQTVLSVQTANEGRLQALRDSFYANT